MLIREKLIRTSPSEREHAQSNPRAVSSLMRELVEMIWVPNATRSAATSAPTKSMPGAKPNNSKATATPGKKEGAIVSAISASRRMTMKALSAPLVNPIKAHPNKARCMNSWRKGSNSQVRLMAGPEKDMGLKSFLDIFRGKNQADVAECHQLTIQKDHLIEQVPD